MKTCQTETNLSPTGDAFRLSTPMVNEIIRRDVEGSVTGIDVVPADKNRSHFAKIIVFGDKDAELAAQIVSDHALAALVPELVEALEALRSTLRPVLRDHEVRGNVDRTEGYVLVAVNQIDAALARVEALKQ